METLQLLGTALGIAALAGVNLYLTVFVTGLAVRFDWIHLAPQYETLAVLGHPVILGIAGVFFVLEFFADKVPWVDTIWDSVHTLIRPVGGAFLAILVLGEPNPVFDVAVGLLAGTVALSTHTFKAASRLVVNASPEPFSNIALSLAEDVAVIGGLGLIVWNPLVGLGLVVLLLAAFFFFGPKVFRAVRSRLFFAWKKLTAPALDRDPADSPPRVPVDVDCLLHQIHPGEVHIEWAVPCHVAKVKGQPANIRGVLVGVRGEPVSVYWVGRSFFRSRWTQIETRDCKCDYERGFLYDLLTIYSPAAGLKWAFSIDRGNRVPAGAVVACFPKQTPSGPGALSSLSEDRPLSDPGGAAMP